jgi:FAD synthetase
VSEHPFQEVDDFVHSTTQTYHLSVTRYAKSMKTAFTDYLTDFPLVRAILVGTRRTDPHGAALTHFDPTDHGWPAFMRVHPVIDWHYVDIWAFIRYLKVPYCVLYDRGYTSLGGTRDTEPNPALRRESSSGSSGSSGKPEVQFRPAYELVDDVEERLGRGGDWKTTKGSAGLMHRVEGGANDVFPDEVAVVDD